MVKKPLAPLVLLALSMMLAACDTTPSPVATLMPQLADACKNHNKDALRACYAKEGVTSDQIDQEIGSWDEYFDPDQHWTYSGITYVSMADAPNNKSILPDTISMAQGATVSGMKFGPNIKVIGFILVSFKDPSGNQAGATEPVGIASDGTSKIASVEPQQ
jgi:hypothetical protein